MGILEKIPTFLTVAVLVIIFVCLKRHARCARLTLWAVGWTLVFTHFLAQLLEPANGQVGPFLLAIDLGSLQAAAIVFLASVSSIVEEKARRAVLLLVVGIPSVAYAVFTCYDIHARWPYIVCLAACLGGGTGFFFWVHRRLSAYLATMALACACAGVWAARAALHGSFDEGVTALLGIGFGLSGVFICRNYWRASPAILTMSAGFFCWGAVFPVGMLIDHFAPNAAIPGELWNIPKLFVAFGMILAIVEDKSESIAGMQRKAQALNCQLQRFSAITSRLLNGAKAESMCPEIASAITEVSNFGSAVIYLEDGERRLRVAASSGAREDSLRNSQGKAQDWTTDDIKIFCSNAACIGRNSFLLRSNECDWTVEELLVPLRSAGGGYLGCIQLGSPRVANAIHADELSHIESLAADLAVAVELKALHMQLVWSEKLAALGQLVAGVAHELNNPLAVIMGYGELMGDEISSARARDQLHKIVGESRRMKKIIDNLLRFSRQSARDTQAVHLAPVLQEVLALREYYLRTHNVRVELEVEPNLAPLAINEDEIKQILLNLLNNSSDALESVASSKRISVRAAQNGSRATILVEDTGPGFANLNRALDPFYTTKPVGKGTGLGLSVCYGIVKERGGDLRIENVTPRGARVIIELPLAEVRHESLVAAVAHA
ncbi:MAG TPA: ATP-binding protein [Terriglobales bacterium]|nr:ATP-binding protein [Terriglobales bacterium]